MANVVGAKRYVGVLGNRMAYVERGEGSPIVFLHGNPTSSYLWRNIIGPLSELGRCIAPDLIGMGDSGKLRDSGPRSYTLAEHQRFVDEFLAKVGADRDVTLVLHDWGSALGFDWARRHAGLVRGIAYMEAVVRPMSMTEWSAAGIFQKMRSPDGEDLVLRDNIFVERILPRSIMRKLTDEEMDEYRRPFRNAGEDRRPTLSWPRQMPFDGEPADVVAVVESYGRWLSTSDVPKLFINAEPGAILTGGMREFCRTWPNQGEVAVKGIHFIQEDSPGEIADALATWLKKLR
ncbi:MAG TPA: haloalkane dehalogenase [Galbitalea sp.]|nr:haloalkane dehalogenase [Galbitalea sp.]